MTVGGRNDAPRRHPSSRDATPHQAASNSGASRDGSSSVSSRRRTNRRYVRLVTAAAAVREDPIASAKDVQERLGSIKATGTFAARRSSPADDLRLEVKGVGRIGWANQILADKAESVVLLVADLPLALKGPIVGQRRGG
jgi:hypothetical protein